jgi:hypothetical protein
MERVSPVEHSSVSVIRGDVRFLGASVERPDLGPIVVYLVPDAPDPVADSTQDLPPVVITSRTPEFAPALSAVARGQRIVLANEGPLNHGLFSAEIGGRRFDLPPGTRSDPFLVPPRGPIRFYCALHADETFVVFGGAVRHISVVTAGQPFVFERVSAGRYTLTIWSRQVEGPVRDVFADGYTSPLEPIWIDPALVRRPLDPEDPS